MDDCKLENCKFDKPHPHCQRCFPVRAHCRTCGKTFDFLPGDPNRGDIYVRDSPPSEWYCHYCQAKQMGVLDKRIEIQKQTTLEGLFDA